MSDDISTADAARRLNTTPPTVRRLLERGDLTGRQEARGGRFSWRVSEASLEKYLDAHGPFAGRRRGASRLGELEDEVRQLRDLLSGTGARPGRAATSQQELDDLRAEAMSLRDAMARLRTAAELQRQADKERARTIQHLLEAASAAERADALRRNAIAELEDGLAAMTQAPHPGGLGG